MNRRTFLRNLGALAAAPALNALSANSQPPNVVLILCDDLGYGDLGCYGSKINTPNIDRMATEGVQFTNFYSASPVCSAARAAILTGRYGVRSGVPAVFTANDADGMALTETTIADMLKPQGYRSMCIGKWHLGRPAKYMPTARGFDEYYGIPYSNDMDPCVLMRNSDVIESPVNLRTLTQRYTDQAVSFIQRSKDKPFFLYFPHTFPHIPLGASANFVGKSGMGLYGDVVQELDWSVGQVMQSLSDAGVDQNTLVLFTSDNGPWFQGSAGRLRGRKGDTFEGGMREPFIARFPGHIPAGVQPRKGPKGRIENSLATALDILPTVAGFTGASLPANPLDGVDIGPVLTRRSATVDRPPFLYFSGYYLHAARVGPWKLHLGRENTPPYTPEPKVGFHQLRLMFPELYNVDKDPEEAVELSAQNPQIVTSIQQAVAQMLPSFPAQVQAAWYDMMSRPVNPNEPGAYPSPAI